MIKKLGGKYALHSKVIWSSAKSYDDIQTYTDNIDNPANW